MPHLSLDIAFSALALGCAAIASVTDLRERRIPNRLTGPAVMVALTLHFAASGWGSFGTATLAGLIGGGAMLLFFLAGGMGAGDVKLMAALGCFVGIHSIGTLLIATALCGGVAGVLLAARRGMLRHTLQKTCALVDHHGSHGLVPHPDFNVQAPNQLRMPFAVPMAMGCLIALCAQLYSQLRTA